MRGGRLLFLLTKRCPLGWLRCALYIVAWPDEWTGLWRLCLELLHSAIDCFRRARYASCLYRSTLLGQQIDFNMYALLVRFVGW